MRELFHTYSLNLYRKIKESKQWSCRREKMSKEIEENETRVTIKRPVWELNLYWKFYVYRQIQW